MGGGDLSISAKFQVCQIYSFHIKGLINKRGKKSKYCGIRSVQKLITQEATMSASF